MGLDDPWRSLTELVQGALFPRHPYRRPVIGYPDTLHGLGVADMRDYYARFYHPGNATLVVCGDVDREEAFALVDRHFGGIPAGVPYATADAWRPAPEEPKGEQRLTMSWPDNGKRLCMGWPTAAVGTDEDYALDLASTLLSGGRMSRLHRHIVLEQGLANSVSTQNDARVEQGAFWIFAECAQGTTPAALEKAIDAEIARLRDELVPAPQLARVKKMLTASEAYDSETVTDLAEEIGEFAVDADWHLALHTIERIQSTDAKALQACVRKFLVPERRVVGWSLPRDTASTASKAIVKRTKSRKSKAPAPGSVSARTTKPRKPKLRTTQPERRTAKSGSSTSKRRKVRAAARSAGKSK
jgi:zinc protease